MHTTEITAKISIKTQFGPSSSVNVLRVLLDIPAIEHAEIVELKTDWIPDPNLPDCCNTKLVNSTFPVTIADKRGYN